MWGERGRWQHPVSLLWNHNTKRLWTLRMLCVRAHRDCALSLLARSCWRWHNTWLQLNTFLLLRSTRVTMLQQSPMNPLFSFSERVCIRCNTVTQCWQKAWCCTVVLPWHFFFLSKSDLPELWGKEQVLMVNNGSAGMQPFLGFRAETWYSTLHEKWRTHRHRNRSRGWCNKLK